MSMSWKYRKKPIEIEAFQYNGWLHCHNMPGWAVDAVQKKTLYFCRGGDLHIKTLEGELTVSEGDYIIRGVNGELYPCKPDIFSKTYERVE